MTFFVEEQRILKDFKARSNSIEVFYKPSESEKAILTRTYFEYDPLVSVLSSM